MQHEDSARGYSEEAMADAMRATENILENDPSRSIADPALPIYQVAAQETLVRLLESFEMGDKMALLMAVRVCANHDLVMPAWVSSGYIRAFDLVHRSKVGKWDDAFGRPYNGAWMERLRRIRNAVIIRDMEKALKSGVAATQAHVEVGSKHNVTHKSVEKLWYDHVKATKRS